jgi:hypothetical protein
MPNVVTGKPELPDMLRASADNLLMAWRWMDDAAESIRCLRGAP